MGERVFDPVTLRLERYMDLLSFRQQLTASNVANADTPGYRTKDIDFQFEYMSAADPRRPHVVEVPELTVKNDGNDVSIDRESRMLAENALRFNVASTLARGRIRAIRNAIQEGRNG